MKSRKRNKPHLSVTKAGQTTPNGAPEAVARAAIHHTSNCSEIYKQCDHRECRTSGACTAEGFVPGRIARCARYWTHREFNYFCGALDFGFIYLCPLGSEHPYLGDIDREWDVNNKPGDVLPLVFFYRESWSGTNSVWTPSIMPGLPHPHISHARPRLLHRQALTLLQQLK
jgi:hypothetical protein